MYIYPHRECMLRMWDIGQLCQVYIDLIPIAGLEHWQALIMYMYNYMYITEYSGAQLQCKTMMLSESSCISIIRDIHAYKIIILIFFLFFFALNFQFVFQQTSEYWWCTQDQLSIYIYIWNARYINGKYLLNIFKILQLN